MKRIRMVGVLLILLCAVGFLTVADDLRHVGELIGVGAIGFAGVILFIVGQLGLRRRRHGAVAP